MYLDMFNFKFKKEGESQISYINRVKEILMPILGDYNLKFEGGRLLKGRHGIGYIDPFYMMNKGEITMLYIYDGENKNIVKIKWEEIKGKLESKLKVQLYDIEFKN